MPFVTLGHYARLVRSPGLRRPVVTVPASPPPATSRRHFRRQTIEVSVRGCRPFLYSILVAPAVRIQGPEPFEKGLSFLRRSRSPADALAEFVKALPQAHRRGRSEGLPE